MSRPAARIAARVLLAIGFFTLGPGAADEPAKVEGGTQPGGAPTVSLPTDATGSAGESGPPEAAGAGVGSDLWQRTRETAEGWWRSSRDLAGQAMEDARGMLGEDDSFGQVWQEAVPKLQKTLVLEDRQAQLPEHAWFGTDQVSNRAEIDSLLDDTVQILSISPVQRFRDRVRAVESQIANARRDIAEYRQARVSAPQESALKRTVADYDRLIAERQADIERLEKEKTQVAKEFAKSVRQLGLELDDEQVEFLLSTVVGDNMVDLGVLFENVKGVTAQLERLVAESGEDLQSARRYYGMYVVLLRALRRMHVQVEESIGERYIPQIDSIVAQAQALTGETLRLQKESPAKRDLLEANLEAQRQTIEAAAIYRQYLLDQQAQVRKARESLDKDISAAWNTYETVRVSGELVALVRSSRELLEGLMNRQVPPLRPFQNLEMRRELEKLTDRLRAAPPR